MNDFYRNRKDLPVPGAVSARTQDPFRADFRTGRALQSADRSNSDVRSDQVQGGLVDGSAEVLVQSFREVGLSWIDRGEQRHAGMEFHRINRPEDLLGRCPRHFGIRTLALTQPAMLQGLTDTLALCPLFPRESMDWLGKALAYFI